MVFRKKDPIFIEPYRGYASSQQIYLRGRVLEDEGWTIHNRKNFWSNFRDQFKRFESDEIPNVPLKVSVQNQIFRTITDSEGYFLLEENVVLPDEKGESWHPVHICIDPSEKNNSWVESWGELLLPNQEADFGIITDVDDTLIKTDVWSKWRTLKNSLFINPAHRKVIKGMPEWLGALRRGINNAVRPVFYVSNSPRNMYQYLLRFLEINRFPKGPLLLQDIGFRSPHLPHHKETEIERILHRYPNLSFILIGDITGDDPRIYAKFKEKYPNQIKSIYIREISHKGRLKTFREWLELNGSDDIFIIKNGLSGGIHSLDREWISSEEYDKLKK